MGSIADISGRFEIFLRCLILSLGNPGSNEGEICMGCSGSGE